MSNPGPRLAVDEGAAAVTECDVNWCSVIIILVGLVFSSIYYYYSHYSLLFRFKDPTTTAPKKIQT
jgi:hypothetical protein